MAPKVKFQREEIAAAALQVLRNKGISGVTSREVGNELGVSSRPIFTWYDSMDELMEDVYKLAREKYREYLENGLMEEIPFFGVGKQYLEFAKDEPEMYKLLFLEKGRSSRGYAMESLSFSQDLVRESLSRIYNIDGKTADRYFRNLWFVVFALATLMVTEDCPYTEKEMQETLTEMSLALCKAYKEIPGFPDGKYDRDKIFSELVKK